MKFKEGKEAVYNDWLAKQGTDPYGIRIMTFAVDWANVMEREMAKGKTIPQCAQAAEREADTDGITGFMYGASVSVLAECWEHGDTLRRWHNKDIQLGTEGDRANENGTVLNPALLTVSVSDSDSDSDSATD